MLRLFKDKGKLHKFTLNIKQKKLVKNAYSKINLEQAFKIYFRIDKML